MNRINAEKRTNSKTVYVVRLRVSADTDGMHALRRLLKFALRACDMRALSVVEEANDPAGSEAGAAS
jgi:hypothetical protein